MTRYLIFDNSSASFGTQKEIIINWDNVKYVEPVDATSFKLQLNNGGNLSVALGTGTPDLVIKAIQDVVRANPSGRELMVSPDSPNAFVISGITFTAPSDAVGIDGSGAQYAVPVFTDTKTITNLPLGTAGQVLTSAGAGANPSWQAASSGVPYILGGAQFNASLKVGDTTTGVLSAAEYNVGLGVASLDAITSADSCTAVGWSALSSVTSGQDNTAMGSLAGNGVNTGQNNVHIGAKSCQSGDTNYNTGVGARTLRFGAAGADNNVAVGFSAGISCEGTQNTMLGAQAGGNLTTGDNNTIVGYDAEPSSGTVSNEITLGNSSVSVIRAAVTSITSLSDERDKKDIKDLTYGLDFVSKLQPREFVWDNRVEKRVVLDDEGNVESELEHYSDNKNKKDFGFIAQEVQAHDDDTLRLIYDANPDKLEMSYGKLVPVLVKAIQELKAQLDNKQDK